MHVKFSLSVFILVIFILSENKKGYAQNVFQSGYLVKSNTDTLYGLIKYRPFSYDDSEVLFKSNSKSNIETFTPNQVSSFSYNSTGYFKSLDIPDSFSGIGRVFAEVLIEGGMSLYQTSFGYLLNKDGEMTLITKEPPTSGERDLKSKIEIREKWRRDNVRSISSLLSGCNRSLVFDLGFDESERSLVRLVVAYNECLGTEFIEYKNESAWIKVIPSVLTGLSLSKPEFSNNQFNPNIDAAKFEWTKALLIGVDVNVYSPRILENVGFSLGLQYQKTDYYGFALIPRNNVTDSYNDFVIEADFISIPFGIRYKLISGETPISFKSGMVLKKYLDVSYLRIEETIVTSNYQSTIHIARYTDELEKYESKPGFWLGLEVGKRLFGEFDFALHLRYENSSSFSNLSSRSHNFQLLLGLAL